MTVLTQDLMECHSLAALNVELLSSDFKERLWEFKTYRYLGTFLCLSLKANRPNTARKTFSFRKTILLYRIYISAKI